MAVYIPIPAIDEITVIDWQGIGTMQIEYKVTNAAIRKAEESNDLRRREFGSYKIYWAEGTFKWPLEGLVCLISDVLKPVGYFAVSGERANGLYLPIALAWEELEDKQRVQAALSFKYGDSYNRERGYVSWNKTREDPRQNAEGPIDFILNKAEKDLEENFKGLVRGVLG